MKTTTYTCDLCEREIGGDPVSFDAGSGQLLFTGDNAREAESCSKHLCWWCTKQAAKAWEHLDNHRGG